MLFGLCLARDLQIALNWFPMTIDIKTLNESTRQLILTGPRGEDAETAEEFFCTLDFLMGFGEIAWWADDDNSLSVYLPKDDYPLTGIDIKQSEDEREITFWYVPEEKECDPAEMQRIAVEGLRYGRKPQDV